MRDFQFLINRYIPLVRVGVRPKNSTAIPLPIQPKSVSRLLCRASLWVTRPVFEKTGLLGCAPGAAREGEYTYLESGVSKVSNPQQTGPPFGVRAVSALAELLPVSSRAEGPLHLDTRP